MDPVIRDFEIFEDDEGEHKTQNRFRRHRAAKRKSPYAPIRQFFGF
jgi:hypothetical protein